MQPALPALTAIIATGLRDAERVRDAALKAVEPLMMLVTSENDIKQFHGLVASMLEVRCLPSESCTANVCVCACTSMQHSNQA